MEGELQHFFHEHLLILKGEDPKTNDDHSDMEINCDGCLTPILGPFYSCGECHYFLHKVCAELPNELYHHMHPQHPLTLLSKPSPLALLSIFSESVPIGSYCDLCRRRCDGFVYRCSICDFDVDTICASTSHTIEDKCHMHPLIPIQIPSSFPCHICSNKEEGVSYKCTICPFWVHQSCIVLPNMVKHSAHHHLLTLLPSMPPKYRSFSVYCDICHDKKMYPFQCSYYCEGCMFFAHISCAISEFKSSSRDQTEDFLPDGTRQVLLPVKQKSIQLISSFVENFVGEDAAIINKIDHFDHDHPLLLIDEEINENMCEACAIPISSPFYGCIECDYFLHKDCTELPNEISHQSHPQHQLTLGGISGFFKCKCCHQLCNGFSYKCFQCEEFKIDIKCASLLNLINHEAHRHTLIPRFVSSATCNACNIHQLSNCVLQCNTCSFNLCFRCAMAPSNIKHRFGKTHPFILTYSPPENHYNEYICELCQRELNPKYWFYHCDLYDQFTHVLCMLKCGADSNIKYGKSDMFKVHEHKLTLISCTYSLSPCSYCREPLRTGFSSGLECIPCKFRIHLQCLIIMHQEKRDLQV